ncbi:MAG: GNAT family N-acetyltransferase [Candidatus Thorarchaeota archaeon]
MLIIQDAKIEDIPDIREIGKRSLWDTFRDIMSDSLIRTALSQWWSRSYLEMTILSTNHITLVAKLDEQIVGYIECEVLEKAKAHALGLGEAESYQAVLWKVFVLLSNRGKGIGTSLINRVIQMLPDNIKNLFVEYVQENERARKFYESNGFLIHHIERPETADGVTHVWMSRQLR